MADVYEEPVHEGASSMWEAIARDDVEYLRSGIVAAALNEDDYETVHRMCVVLSAHADEYVRGNAVFGFGHLARLFSTVSAGDAEIVRAAFEDGAAHVRGHANSAADDILMFVGVDVRKPGGG